MPVDAFGNPAGFDTDKYGRSKKFTVFSCMRPWFRSFHFSWFSFFLAFTGWFSIVPALEYLILDPSNDIDLAATKTSNIISVLATVFFRFALGPLCEKFGPRRLQCFILGFGAICVLISSSVTSTAGLYTIRFFIGFVGGAFVPCQYWTTMMFAGEVVGQANAFAGGWGNLGGGFTTIFVAALVAGFQNVLDDNTAWRVAMLVPGAMMLSLAIPMFFLSDDCPQGHWKKRLYNQDKTETEEDKIQARKEALEPWLDWRVWLLFLQYAGCFGVELTINNSMTSYLFRNFLETDPECASVDAYNSATNSSLSEAQFLSECSVLGRNNAAMIAGLFGLMNLFARALGGLLSDRLNRIMNMRGRILTQFGCLFGEGICLIVFSRIESVEAAIPMLILFSVFVQSSEGASFALVPFMCKNVGAVAGIVGAGGNAGAVSWATMLREVPSTRDAYLYLGFIVLGTAFLSFLYPVKGTYLTCGPSEPLEEVVGTKDSKAEVIAEA